MSAMKVQTPGAGGRARFTALVRVLARVQRRIASGRPLTAKQAADLVNAAKGLIEYGRAHLAVARRHGDPTAFIGDVEWRDAAEALRRARKRLLAVDGVVGVALGFRRRNGTRIPERCVVVLTKRKLSLRRLSEAGRRQLPTDLPSYDGRRVPVDVVAFGALRRQYAIQAGVSIGPRAYRREGTLGTFALDATGSLVALTAQHVFAGIASRSRPNASVTAPSQIYSAGAPLLGEWLDGSMDGTDAAAIALDPTVAATWEADGIPIRGARSLSLPGDEGLTVQLVGAESGHQFGVLEHFGADFPAYDLREAITAYIHTTKGDSGAALLDRHGYVLGLLVGQPTRDGPRVFCSIGSALDELSCTIPNR